MFVPAEDIPVSGQAGVKQPLRFKATDPRECFANSSIVPLSAIEFDGKRGSVDSPLLMYPASTMNANDITTLVEQYYEPLYRFAFSLTQTEADARDLTQHTFYVLATKGHQLRDPSKAKTWLFTTLHRAFLKSRRRKVRFPHCDLDEASSELPIVSPNFASEIDSAQLLSALAKLDELFRAALALFYIDDRTHKEIALILGVPEGTIKSRLARGVAQLREILV